MKKGPVKIRGIRSPIPSGHVLGRTRAGAGDAHLVKAGRALSLGDERLDVTLSGDVEIDQKGDATVVGLQKTPIDPTPPTNLYVLTFDSGSGMWKPAAAAAGAGDVVGPGVAVNNHVVFFDGTTGKLIKDSGLALSGSNTGDQTLPTAANPTATAGDAAVNGSATSFMRSDGAPAIQKSSSSVFGLAKVDGTTITASGGVITAVAGAGYTDEQAQDAVGAMVDGTLVYVDATPLLTRAALTGDVTAAQGSNALAIGAGKVTEAMQVLANNTTQNVSTSKHGYAPILPNDATKYLDGTGAYTVPAGSGGSGTVTSVGVTSTDLSVSGSPITTSGSITLNVNNDAITYAKMQNVSATQRILGRNTAGAGDPEEVTATQALDWLGSTRGQILYRNATVWTVLSPGTAGFVLSSNGAGADPSYIAASSVTSVTDADIDMQWFGDGSDGAVAVTTSITLARDMFYSSLTISGSGSIDTSGFRIHVSGTLDISAAAAAGIKNTGGAGANGLQNGGGSSSSHVPPSGTIGGAAGTTGGGGAAGGTGAGTAAAAVSTYITLGGALGGAGGAGGAVGGTAGGGSRGETTPTGGANSNDVRYLSTELATWVTSSLTRILGGACAPGGSSGAGDGTGSGGGGGEGGRGGGVIWIAAKTIARGTSVTASIIQALGGAGGNGASGNALGTNHGGGGGAAGGGGGWIVLIYRTLTGSVITNAVDATGGNGGSGGNGVGTGIGGDGGGSGGGGRIDVYDLGAGTQTITSATAAVAGNAHSSGTGGGTKTATAQKVNL